jgi:hypothetical protein
MNRTAATLALLACTVTASASAHAGAERDADPVRAAFARLLDHAPTPAAARPPAAADNDPLHALLLHALPPSAHHRPAALPDRVEKLVANVPADPLAAAFQRMLDHQPAPEPATLAATGAADPLTAMLAARLWLPPQGRPAR